MDLPRPSSPAPDACIIGLGSRGLGVLERIVTLTSAPGWGTRPFTVDVVDPRCDGTGLHDPDQPDYLLLNTVCCQVSAFPEESTVGAAVGERGPNLYDWVRERDLRLAADGFTLGTTGRRVRPDDYLPRRILGTYLSWFLQRILARVPGHLTVRFHRAEAVGLASPDDGMRQVTLDDGTVLSAPSVFLTTGHTPAAAAPDGPGEHRRIRDVYPPARRFAAIRAEQTVALAGTGLSGMDALAALTLGRGGRYVTDGGRPRYLPSGAEPRILLYSRTGLPFRARPKAAAPGSVPYAPLVLTPRRVDALRAHAPGEGLSLHGDLLPLVHTEMRIAFHLRCAALGGGPAAERRTQEALREARDTGRLETALGRLDGEHRAAFGEFDPRRVLFPEPGGLADSAAYQEWYTGRIEDDLAHARLGLSGSPLKAALEVLRSRRDVLRHAVDFGGLEEKSHDEFYGSFTAVLNRSVTGPQLDRHQELLALVRAGVVAVPLGPEPDVAWDEATASWRLSSTRLAEPYTTAADWLCHATSGQPDVERTGSRLLAQLARDGLIRRHRPSALHSRGADLSPGLHPVGRGGEADERIWVLGPLSEGATFYNHYVPSPGGFSRALSDAHRAVAAMLAVAGRAGARPVVTTEASR